jgi:hypothetical protein
MADGEATQSCRLARTKPRPVVAYRCCFRLPFARGGRRSPEVPTHASKFGVPTIRVKQHTFGATVLGCVWVWHHWKTEGKHHWEHAWRTNFEKLVIGEIGVATIGVEQHTFGASVLGCVCRCGTIGKPNDPIIGNTHVNKFPKHIIIGGFGWRRLVASNRSNGNFTNGGGGSGGGGWC